MQQSSRFVIGLIAVSLAAVAGTVLTFVATVLVALLVTTLRDGTGSYEGPLVAGMIAAPIGGVLATLVTGAVALKRSGAPKETP